LRNLQGELEVLNQSVGSVGISSAGSLLNFITNEDYVTEEHQRQLKHGLLQYYFEKFEFTKSE